MNIQSIAAELEMYSAADTKNYNGVKDDTEAAFRFLLSAMFPKHVNPQRIPIAESLKSAYVKLTAAISVVIDGDAEGYTLRLMEKLPRIRLILKTDIIAAYRGDPAAKNPDEVIVAYPAFTAISAYRVGHELYAMGVPLIPRVITEYAHRLTGIDIHPGARIGEYFFIDHGTGVVIGETATIGDRVKLYQHVTIGAKSFDVAPDGSLVKGIKRHPDIGNDVVIYAGATILGGDTYIGDKSVIGGNVWLTHSVEAGSVVVNER